MRYLLAFLAVSAFALMTATALPCPSDALYVPSDAALPDSTEWISIDPEECPNVICIWKFIRTANNTGRTIVCAAIEGTNLLTCIDSAVYPPGLYVIINTGSVGEDTEDVRAIMWGYGTGHFVNLSLCYRTY